MLVKRDANRIKYSDMIFNTFTWGHLTNKEPSPEGRKYNYSTLHITVGSNLFGWLKTMPSRLNLGQRMVTLLVAWCHYFV